MLKALVPVDGSAAALRAVDYAIKLVKGCELAEIHLVNIQAPADSWEIKSFLKASEIEAMQESRGGDALASARELLDRAGIEYTPAVLLGPVAETLVKYAQDQGCEHILMGNRGESMIEEVTLGSVAHEVLRLTPLPVTFVK